MVAVDPPLVGPCAPWATPNDVSAIGVDALALDNDKLALNLTIASQILYIKSAFQFPGKCAQTIRPITRLDCQWSRHEWESWGYPFTPELIAGRWYNFGLGTFGGHAASIGVFYEGGHRVPRIDLGQYPVTEIVSVKIDGAVFPYAAGANYRLDGWRWLTRTDGQLWPIDQNLLLADTQPKTWSVSVKYGQPVPQMGVMAAAQLASELTKHMDDSSKCALPLRVTAINRQGVTYSLPDVMSLLDKGRTGLYLVDLFLATVNPNNLQRPARVLSPDISARRRIG